MVLEGEKPSTLFLTLLFISNQNQIIYNTYKIHSSMSQWDVVRKYTEGTLFHCRLEHHKSRMKWSRIEHWRARRVAGV